MKGMSCESKTESSKELTPLGFGQSIRVTGIGGNCAELEDIVPNRDYVTNLEKQPMSSIPFPFISNVITLFITHSQLGFLLALLLKSRSLSVGLVMV